MSKFLCPILFFLSSVWWFSFFYVWDLHYLLMLSFLFSYYFWLLYNHLAYANLVPVSNNLRAWGGLSRIFSLPELESVLNMCSSWIIWKMHKNNHEQFSYLSIIIGGFSALPKESKSLSISIRAKPTNQNEHRQI